MSQTQESREEIFFLTNLNTDTIFHAMERADYYSLHYIRICTNQLAPGEKMYLYKLKEALGVSMPDLSNAIQNLQDKGYLMWKTDHEVGKTYVELTSRAVELMNDQQDRMKRVYQAVVNEIGDEELDRTVGTMKKIKDIIDDMNEKKEEE